jgi:hypothetical protein
MILECDSFTVRHSRYPSGHHRRPDMSRTAAEVLINRAWQEDNREIWRRYLPARAPAPTSQAVQGAMSRARNPCRLDLALGADQALGASSGRESWNSRLEQALDFIREDEKQRARDTKRVRSAETLGTTVHTISLGPCCRRRDQCPCPRSMYRTTPGRTVCRFPFHR